MTTSVTIKTRAWPATVIVTPAGENSEKETHEVAPHGVLDLHVTGDTTVQVTEREPTAGEGETIAGEEKAAEEAEPVPQFRRGAKPVEDKVAEEA